MVLRARLEVSEWVWAWLVVGSCVNINRTRAAAAREGCREMDAARKNRKPGVWAERGVLEGRDWTWWWCGAGAGGAVVFMMFAERQACGFALPGELADEHGQLGTARPRGRDVRPGSVSMFCAKHGSDGLPVPVLPASCSTA